ncbi:hypothetical protein E4T56_gene17380 [Termitomyces sp. T112]|nr:hypothetical protein E4T56_gene17380 [Termitomyces sp. T112]
MVGENWGELIPPPRSSLLLRFSPAHREKSFFDSPTIKLGDPSIGIMKTFSKLFEYRGNKHLSSCLSAFYSQIPSPKASWHGS